MKFNEKSEKPAYIFRHNPLVPRSYQILHYRGETSGYEPVGEYTVIDLAEEADITEKKLANLVAIMNGKQSLIDFKNLTNQRILYNIVTADPASAQQKVVFRTYDGSGVSTENAVLTIEKGVFDE